jgi:type IV pilus assembly protein PilV
MKSHKVNIFRIGKMQNSLINNQHGATLIEILIAVLILSLGILGMAALQARALKGNTSSFQRTQAVMLSSYMMDAMRVDANTAKSLDYNTGTLDSNGVINGSICNPASITGASLSEVNKKHWLQAIKNNMGTSTDTTSCGAIYCDATGSCKVQIIWDDSLAGGLGTQRIETQSKL